MHQLHLRHRHQQVLVGATGQLRQHLGPAPADQDRRERLTDLLQPRVAGDATGFVLGLVFVQQLPGRSQPVLVDELHDRDELFELVFQRRASEHEGVRTVDTLERPRGDRVPVLDALRLVDDHQFRRPLGDQVQIRLQLLVVGDLAEFVGPEVLLPLCPAAGHDSRCPPRKAADFVLPLVLERGRAHHQHARHAEVARQDLHCRDRLDGLAQAHLVADQSAAGAHREQRAVGLVGVQRRLQQLRQLPVGRAARKLAVENLRPPRRIAPAGDEVERIVVGAQFVTASRRRREEMLQLVEAPFGEQTAARGIEKPRRRFQQGRRAVRAGAEMHSAPSIVAQIDLGKRRTPPAGEGGLRPTLLPEPGQNELDVLAGAQLVGGVVRAGAVVVAGTETAYRHAIAGLRLWVADAKLRKERLVAPVLQSEHLIAPELAAQCALPVGGRDVHRRMGARELRLLDGSFGSRLAFHC